MMDDDLTAPYVAEALDLSRSAAYRLRRRAIALDRLHVSRQGESRP